MIGETLAGDRDNNVVGAGFPDTRELLVKVWSGSWIDNDVDFIVLEFDDFF